MDSRASSLTVCLLASSLVIGCGDDDDADARVAPQLTVATFNAGLIANVGYLDARAARVVDALAELEADVLCVQEFWSEEHWDALVAANADVRPHVLRIEAMPGAVGQCTPDEFEPLRTCAELACAGEEADALVTCVSTMCQDETVALSSTCITCLLDNATGGIDVFQDACLGSGSGGATDGGVPADERSYFLGGSFGIGLLSKLPLNEPQTLVLDSSGNRRGVLHATTDVETLGEIAVLCTHLSAVQNNVRYEGSYGDWESENAAHARALVDFADDQAGGEGPVLVLGDLNCGPARPGVEAELADSYAELANAGFVDPFLDGDDAACTFCSANALVGSDDTGVDAAIDHILTRGLDAQVATTRVLMESFQDPGADGGAADTIPLSDHYGLRATINATRD